MKRLLFVLALLLTGCADQPTSGYIYKKPYEGESYWYSSHCAMTRTVTSYRTVNDYDAKGRIRGSHQVPSTSRTVCIMTLQDRHTNPPSWGLCLKDDKDPKNKGCFSVPESTWNRYEIGYHYPNPM